MEPDKFDLVEEYRRIIQARSAMQELQNAIHVIKAIDSDFPDDAELEKVYFWLYTTQLRLEKELNL